jgi:hypothetical protein
LLCDRVALRSCRVALSLRRAQRLARLLLYWRARMQNSVL